MQTRQQYLLVNLAISIRLQSVVPLKDQSVHPYPQQVSSTVVLGRRRTSVSDHNLKDPSFLCFAGSG
jgi:hypothetical protein